MQIKDLSISSPDFAAGERLQDRHAHLADNLAPRLEISGVPEGAAELAVLCHDPDAPVPFGCTHWVITGIDPAATVLDDIAVQAATLGTNDFGNQRWDGPMPPAGHGEHHYYFWVYALDTSTEGPLTGRDFLQRYADHVIEQNRVVATYSA